MSIEIRDVRAICTAPEGINLVAVKIETNEPELYGVGCATFAHRYSAVVLRSIVMESNISSNTSSAQAAVRNFDMGIKMGAVMLTSLPIMCVFPFLQKHFAKGVMVGAIKA